MSINLTAINQKLKLVTSAAVQTQVVASGRDNASSVQTPISQDTNVTTAATTDIVAVPGASTQRLVDDVEINIVGSGTQQVTVQKDVGGTVFQLYTALLNSGDRVHFTNDGGWRTFAFGGQEKGNNVGFSLIKAPILVLSGTSYTPSVNCTALLFELWGQGAQGGGSGTASGAATNADVGSGGWAGAYGRKFLIGIPSSFTISIGNASQTGTGSTNGTDGASTTVTINGITYTAVGGKGGIVGAGFGTSVLLTGLSSPIALGSHNCDEAYLGAPGTIGIRLNGTQAASGQGGSADGIGQGGQAATTDVAGNNASGIGSGGGGGCALNATVRAGGLGSQGGIRFWEFTS
jgi:hypothetical protein